jgi:hypothetical protein
MISKLSSEDACFEDAYIKSFSMQGNDLKLDLDCLADIDDRFMPDEKAESVMVPVSITFKDGRNLTIDGIE